jgi:Kef-type K+ transport system membrane component KefB
VLGTPVAALIDQPGWQLLMCATLLVVGYAAGEWIQRLRLPRLIGYLLIGALLGRQGLNLITPIVYSNIQLFVDVGFGMLLYDLGQRLDFQWMWRERWILVMAAGEMLLSFCACYFLLTALDFEPLQAARFAALTMSTSPIIVMYMARELGAEGQVTSRMLTLASLDSLGAFALSASLLSWNHLTLKGDIESVSLSLAYLLIGSAILGGLLYVTFHFLARWLSKSGSSQFILAMSMVLLGVGLAETLGLSVLCTLLAAGICVRNMGGPRHLEHVEFGVTAELFCVVLFISAGASWQIVTDAHSALAAAAVIGVRYLGKALPIYASAAFTPLGLRRAGLLALAMTPLSGFTTIFLLAPAGSIDFASPNLGPVLLTAVAILEILGPILVRFALRVARESRPVAVLQGAKHVNA